MGTEILLGIITFFTSTVAGVVGLGGGMILIAILPAFLPVNALIPIHGLTQMSSNLSRAVFGYKDIQKEVILKFVIGSLFGTALFSSIIYFISLDYVPIFIGFYILLSLWSKRFNDKIKKFESYYIIGFFQTGLSLVVGATGPLATTLLLKDYDDKDKVVATAAVLMSITHIFKVFVFIGFGFAFFEYIWLLIFMISGAIAGSYFGTVIRKKVDGAKFKMVLKVVLSLLAIKVILGVIL